VTKDEMICDECAESLCGECGEPLDQEQVGTETTPKGGERLDYNEIVAISRSALLVNAALCEARRRHRLTETDALAALYLVLEQLDENAYVLLEQLDKRENLDQPALDAERG